MEIENILKMILFFTTAGASIISFKIIKDNNIPMPKNIAEARQVSEKIFDKAPDTMNDIWTEDIQPTTQRITQWFSANVVSEAEEFFEKEIEPKVKEQIEKQESVIKEQIPKTLNDIKDVLTGDKKCELICE